MTAIAIRQVALDGAACLVDIPRPGIVRHVAIGGEAKRVVGLDGQSRVQERVVLFVEYDPERVEDVETRQFVSIEHGRGFSPKEGKKAVWCGCGLSYETGAVVYVYELVDETRSRLELPNPLE